MVHFWACATVFCCSLFLSSLCILGKGDQIIGGIEVTPHSIKHQVSIRSVDFGTHFCSGSVLSEDKVITAAHCFIEFRASDVVVVAGEHDLVLDEGTEQNVEVAEVQFSSCWDEPTLECDIAILKLKEKLLFNDFVGPVSLPRKDQAFHGQAQVSGWGPASEGELPSVVLRASDVPLHTDKHCLEAYGDSYRPDTMLCAGRGGSGFCVVDDGGPLICEENVLCGIVSWAKGCADDKYYGVYGEVSKFVDFIGIEEA